MNFLTDVVILNWPIPARIILFIFIGIAVVALLLFIFNLIFNKGSNQKKKSQVLSPDEVEKKENFELQKNNIETEISLVLKLEDNKNVEVKDESRELQQ